MKQIYTLIVIVFLSTFAWSQTPQKMSYQAIVRNNNSQLVINQTVGMRISILKGSSAGPSVYSETQTPTTNTNGLISIEIGAIAGFDTIHWADGPYFIKTETDPTGGTDYSIVGINQLLSVPYALFAENSANDFSGSYRDLTNIPSTIDTNRNDDVLTSGNQSIMGTKTFTGTVNMDSIFITQRQSKWVFPASDIFVPNPSSGVVNIEHNTSYSFIAPISTGERWVTIGFNLPYQILGCPQKIKSVTINYRCGSADVYISNLFLRKSNKGTIAQIASSTTDLTSLTASSYTLNAIAGNTFADQKVFLDIGITFNSMGLSDFLYIYEIIVITD